MYTVHSVLYIYYLRGNDDNFETAKFQWLEAKPVYEFGSLQFKMNQRLEIRDILFS